MTLGAWTPWLAAALLVAGVIVAVRRPRAVVGTGIALAVIGLALCAVLAIARGRVVSAIDGTIVTPEAARVAYDALAPWILWPAIAITAVGVVAVAAAVVGRRIRRPR
jgi:drug/metabolite transporter (DMT)-like permease